MEVNNTTQTTTTYNKSTQSNKTDDTFNNILIKNVEVKSDGELPSIQELWQLRRQEYKDSFTDEKFEELLDKLDINNLNDSEKELYKSIIDDRYITHDEVKDLSYEQIETLNKFLSRSDEYDNRIEETSINSDINTKALLDIPKVSNNETFNKSVLQAAKQIDEKYLKSFLITITGVHHLPSDDQIDYDTQDAGEVLQKRILDHEKKLDTPLLVGEIEYYKNTINTLTNVLDIYGILSDENNNEIRDKQQAYLIDIKQDLMDDLLSLLKTGMTVSENETLDELVSKINKMIEDSQTEDIDEDLLNDMVKELHRQLEQIQKRMGGDGKIETDETQETKDSENLSLSIKEFKSMMVDLKAALEDLKAQNIKKENFNSTQDELALREQLKEV